MNALASEFKVIDSDTHIVEPYDLWTARVSTKKWGDDVPHVKWDEGDQEEAWFAGDAKLGPAAGLAIAGWNEYPPDHPRKWDDVGLYAKDVNERLRLMDEYGIHAHILYPNVGGFGGGKFTSLKEPELKLECVRAYNDWLAEYSSAAPGRLIPVMATPFWDLEETLKEVERAASLGHKGINFTNTPEFFGQPKLSHPFWDKLWAQAQEMGLPINFHIGGGDPSPFMVMDPSAGSHAAYSALPVLFTMDNVKVIAQLICGGVCHRFPKLNFVNVESGVGWLPFAVDMLDWMWKNTGAHEEHPEYELLPSEFFKRQIYGCFWFEEKTLKSAIEHLGADNILYESDFPHPTSMSPGPCSFAKPPKDYIQDVLGDLPRDVAGKILHDNAARIYNLD